MRTGESAAKRNALATSSRNASAFQFLLRLRRVAWGRSLITNFI